MERRCQEPGCERTYLAKGKCWYHYAQTRGTCQTAGCARAVRARGLCSTHYDHARGKYVPRGSLQERFWGMILGRENTDACWLWQGAKQSDGYGSFRYQGRTCLTHRVSWELHNGSIPEARGVRQVCGNRVCVNPKHLALTDFLVPFNESFTAKFWRRVQKTEGCWLWAGTKNRSGYGQVAVPQESKERKQEAAHRMSWGIHYGPIPEGIKVLHHCDNPGCVRPDHLFLGTQAENVADMDAKGRRSRRLGPEGKLSMQQVREMRLLRQAGMSTPEMARRFNVSQATAWKATTAGWSYKWIEDNQP